MRISLLLLLAFTSISSQAQKPRIVTASQVNGTWRSHQNEFKIWALGKQKLQVDFAGVYEYDSPYGPTANTGQGSGVALIEGDTASFKPEGAEEECSITLKFKAGKLFVTQTGICGFGHNVMADGTYRRVSTRKPKFGFAEP